MSHLVGAREEGRDVKPLEMERAEAGSILSEELVERIVAMLPFPSILKARGLSRSWRAKFAAIASQEDEETKSLAASFHKQVGEWSSQWESFCPVFLGKEDVIAHHSASQNWRRLSSLSFLPKILFQTSRNTGRGFLDRSYLQIEGALLYGFVRSETGFYEYDLYVANIFTRSWKKLPSRPKDGLSFVLCNKLVSDMASNTYKMVLVCQNGVPDDFDHYSVQIYDSEVGLWSAQNFVVTSDFFLGASTAAFLNGVLYMVAVNNPQNFLAFGVADGTLKEVVLSFNEKIEIVSVNLLVCNANRLFLVTKSLHPEAVQVLKVDLESQRLVQLSGGPPALYEGKMDTHPVSEGNCIFFRVEEHGTRVLAYNVDEEEWRSFPIPANAHASRTYKWIASSFKPGLGPFVAV